MTDAPLTPPAGDPPSSPPPAAPPAGDPPPSPPPAGPWYEPLGLDEAARTFIAGKGFQSAADAFKSAMEADRMVRERNVIPAPDADPAKRIEWDGWSKLGWTAERDKYGVEPARPPEGKTYDADLDKVFLDAAHAARVPAWQAQAIRDEVAKFGYALQDKLAAEGQQAVATAQAALQAEWGDQFAANQQKAKAAAQLLGVGAEDVSALEKLTGAPGLMKLFAKIGDMLGEDAIKSAGGAGAIADADAARAERLRLQADPEFMKILGNRAHPQWAEATARRNALLEREMKKG